MAQALRLGGLNGIGATMRAGILGCVAVALVACQSVEPGSPSAISPGTGSGTVTVGAALASPSVSPTAYAAPAATAVARGYSELVIDLSSGLELHEVDADEARFPASLTKMMTLYLLFDEVRSGRMSLSTELSVSAHAAKQPPAKLGLQAGGTITVEQAARSMAVKSANDVAVVVAEAISGSETAFARKMTSTARSLGMRQTRFRNASGLPDPGHVSTARDMAKLGRALKSRFPQYASYYRARSFQYKGKTFKATNNLLGRVAGVDGLKTGYIRLSGYNLVATARRNGRSVLVVVMGGASEGARDQRVAALLDDAF